MLLRNLKGRNPITLLLIPIIGFLLWINAFGANHVMENSHDMPLYSLLRIICFDNWIVLNIFALCIIIANAFMLNRLNETFIFVKQRTNLPGLIYVILACGLISIKGMLAAIPASFFIILAINRSFASYQKKDTSISSFDIGFICSIALLFYINLWPYLIWVWFVIIVLEQIKIKNILASSLGFITPLLLSATYYYLSDKKSFVQQIRESISDTNIYRLGFDNLGQTSLFIFISFLSLISISFLFRVFEDKKIRSRKYFIILISLFVVTLSQYFLMPTTGLGIYFILILPLSYIISHYFILQQNRYWGEIFFILLILVSFICNYIL